MIEGSVLIDPPVAADAGSGHAGIVYGNSGEIQGSNAPSKGVYLDRPVQKIYSILRYAGMS